jgi:hypothetical protein
VRRAAATRVAGDHTADRAQLHPQIVGGDSGAVYSPAVLGLRVHASAARSGCRHRGRCKCWRSRPGPHTGREHRATSGRAFLTVPSRRN